MNKARIAILDEEWGNDEALCQLMPEVAEVINFTNGDELLRNARCEQFDCVLLGGAAARKLHLSMIERGCTVPVLYLAAHPSVEEAVAAIKLGAVEYLCKPLQSNRLRLAIEAALRQKRSGVPDRFFAAGTGLDPMLDVMEREMICAALMRSRGVVGGRKGAAALLGVTRTGLLYKMKRLNISRALIEEDTETESAATAPAVVPAGDSVRRSGSSAQN